MKNTCRLSPVTRGMYIAHLKAIINQAIRDKKVSCDMHPFEYYERPKGVPKEHDISVADLKTLRDAEIKKITACCKGCIHAFILPGWYQSDGFGTIQFQRCRDH